MFTHPPCLLACDQLVHCTHWRWAVAVCGELPPAHFAAPQVVARGLETRYRRWRNQAAAAGLHACSPGSWWRFQLWTSPLRQCWWVWAALLHGGECASRRKHLVALALCRLHKQRFLDKLFKIAIAIELRAAEKRQPIHPSVRYVRASTDVLLSEELHSRVAASPYLLCTFVFCGWSLIRTRV